MFDWDAILIFFSVETCVTVLLFEHDIHVYY